MTKGKLLFSLSKNNKDFVIETFRCGSAGGQNVNKVETGVRIKHPASGAIGESREQRTQGQNKKTAFLRLTKTKIFQDWIKFRSALELQGIRDFEKYIDSLLVEKNLKVEIFKNGEWKKQC